MSYIGNEPIVSATRTITEITATAGQTVFVANGGYTVGYIDVFLNGAQLQTSDFTATNGSSITLTEAAQVGDVLKLVAWGTFSTSNLVSPNYTGTLTGGTGVVNIGSGQIYKDASGNVGIGTASPQSALQVSGEMGGNPTGQGVHIGVTANYSAIQLNGASNTGSNIDFSTSGTDYLGRIFYDNTSNFMSFGTNSVERMRIDSAGRVTKPYQPFFMGRPTTDYSGGSMPTGIIPVTSIYNNGGHFNSTNSRFTAPVAGWYRTTWGGLQTKSTVVSLMVNGGRTHNGNHFEGTATINFVTMTQTAIRYLNAGDYLNIEGWNGGGYYSDWYLWTVELVG